MITTVTTTATRPGSGSRTLSPAAGWPALGRVAAAAALAGGGALWLVGDLVGFGHSGVDRGSYVQAHPAIAGVGVVADMLGTTLLFFALPVWLLLSRQRSPRLAWTGAILGTFGMAAQAVLHGVDITDYMMARSGTIDFAAFHRVIDSGSGLPFAVFMVMFLIGAFVGTAITMVALWRAGTLPRPALLLWVAFLVVNLVSVPMPTTILAFLALAWMALAIARSHDDRLR
jgi:hypothetical protein